MLASIVRTVSEKYMPNPIRSILERSRERTGVTQSESIEVLG
jgi:hypothetical protein